MSQSLVEYVFEDVYTFPVAIGLGVAVGVVVLAFAVACRWDPAELSVSGPGRVLLLMRGTAMVAVTAVASYWLDNRGFLLQSRILATVVSLTVFIVLSSVIEVLRAPRRPRRVRSNDEPY